MSCACENLKRGRDIDRIRRLAKAFAVGEGVTVGIYKKADGTFGFTPMIESEENEIIEYITPY